MWAYFLFFSQVHYGEPHAPSLCRSLKHRVHAIPILQLFGQSAFEQFLVYAVPETVVSRHRFVYEDGTETKVMLTWSDY